MQNQIFQNEDVSLDWVTISKVITNPQNSKQGNLFLGNSWSAKNLKILESNNINFVLSIYDFCDISYQKENNITHLVISAKDEENFDLKPYIYKSIDFIESSLKLGNVLVHCSMGKSRSASVVIAFFMKIYRINFQKAFEQVKDIKPDINPNNGFKILLSTLKF